MDDERDLTLAIFLFIVAVAVGVIGSYFALRFYMALCPLCL